MSRSYSDAEKAYIKENLITQAEECIKKFGMKKTTVDELTSRCRIAKGSFYHFYSSKELLFWDVVIKWHKEIQEESYRIMNTMDEVNVENMTDLICACYLKCFDIGLGDVLSNKELEDLIPKLPPEILKENEIMDEDFMKQILAILPGGDKLDLSLYTGAFDGVFLILFFRDHLGERFKDILRVIVRGLVVQMLQEIQEGQ